MHKHPSTLASALKDNSLIHEEAFIGGKWVSGPSTFPVYDPATNGIIANIANLGASDFTTAIEHAQNEFKTFKNTSETDRAKMLHAWAALIRKHSKDLGVLLTMENGKTLAEAEGEVEYGASFIT